MLHLSSITKKYLMALTGLVFTGFVLFHMLGNLQMFQGPDAINRYAHFLKTLPPALLWGLRLILLVCFAIHTLLAIILTRENKKARPNTYASQKTIQASLGSKTMGISGSILLIFIVFHILHFTTRVIYPEYQSDQYYTLLNGQKVFNVYQMVIDGFSHTWVSIFYILAMGCLCLHLSHGASSLFQSLGLRNKKWRHFFDLSSKAYGWIIFLGFVSIPCAVLISKYSCYKIFPINTLLCS